MFKNLFINLLCAFLMVGANIFLKIVLADKGFSWRGSVVGLGKDLLQLLSFPLIWAGILLFVAANVLWLMILATQKLGIAYPLQIALVFLFSTTASVFVFSEKLTAISVVGLVLVVCGMFIITKG
jgi:multidrug transporter EmrE-like cation transporter